MTVLLPILAAACVGGVVVFVAFWHFGKAIGRATSDRIFRSM